MDKQTKALVGREVGDAKWAQGKARAKHLVTEGADLERRQSKLSWAWGDLSLEIVPAAKGTAVSRVLLDAFIDDYGYPHTSRNLVQLRGVCTAWPRDKRTKAPISVHLALCTHPRRFELVRDDTTYAEARKLAAWQPQATPSSGRTATAIECANATKGWARSLDKRAGSAPSQELVDATADAWRALTGVVDRFGLLDELVSEFQDQASELVPA